MLTAFLGAGLTTVNGVGTEWLFWASVGVIGAARARPLDGSQGLTSSGNSRAARRRDGQRPSLRITGRDLVGLSCVALGVVAALSTLTALDASHAAKASQQARLQGRSQQAIEFGLRATQADQGRPDYWDALGLAYVEAQRLNDAALAFSRAS